MYNALQEFYSLDCFSYLNQTEVYISGISYGKIINIKIKIFKKIIKFYILN